LFINYHSIIVLLKQSPTAYRVLIPAGWCASTHGAQRTELAVGQLSRFHHKNQWPKIRRIQTQWTITCDVQCWRLTASL